MHVERVDYRCRLLPTDDVRIVLFRWAKILRERANEEGDPEVKSDLLSRAALVDAELRDYDRRRPARSRVASYEGRDAGRR